MWAARRTCYSPPRAAGIQMRKTRGPNMGTMARVTISAKDEQDAVCQLSQHTKHTSKHAHVRLQLEECLWGLCCCLMNVL